MFERSRIRSQDSGQASVELLAAIPLVVLLGLAVWQSALAGLTAERAARAARVTSRAVAVGEQPRQAIRKVLPQRLARDARIKLSGNKVTISLAVPSVLPSVHLGSVTASASFPVQQ